MKATILALVLNLLLPAAGSAAVNCADDDAYNFDITPKGNHYLIKGVFDQIHKGSCEAVARTSSDGHVLLIGINPDTFLRDQCYADIVIGQKYSSEVSVPDDKTYAAVKQSLMLCTGSL